MRGGAATSGIPAESIYLSNPEHWSISTSPLFDGGYYLRQNPDVAEATVNPLLHYVMHGFHEGRSPSPLIDLEYVLEQLEPGGEPAHTVALLRRFTGLAQLLTETHCNPNRLFNNDYYLLNPGLQSEACGPIPIEHYVRSGGKGPDGRYLECSPVARLGLYMDRHPDLVKAGVLPLQHLLEFGLDEGREFTAPDVIDPRFLAATAQLLGDPSVSTVRGFLEKAARKGHLGGPAWPSEHATTPLPALRHRAATNHRSAFIGVVLFHNSDEELRQLAESIRRESIEFPDYGFEYAFLVNDPENLERYQVLLGQERVRTAPGGANVGFGAGHNLLMAGAFRRNWLYIGANPDGYFVPGCLRTLVDFVDFHGRRCLAEASTFPTDHPKWFDPIFLDTSWVSGACFALPRSLWEDVHGFDEDLHLYCEDVDLSWRVKLAGGTLKVCPTARFFHDITGRGLPAEGGERPEREARRRQSMLSGAYYLARKWGNEDLAERMRTEVKKIPGAILPEPRVRMDPSSARMATDFRFDRFAPSRFWVPESER